MDNLNLYDVDKDYILFLQEAETQHRGFTRVPNMEYEGEQKFLCGIVLQINGLDYYVPISSYKNKQSESILIIFPDDNYNPIKGSLRFNYMIPVPQNKIKVRVIKDEQRTHRRLFLHKQLEFCNTNVEKIRNQAMRTYKRIINNYNPSLSLNSCDFQFLEQKCMQYVEMQKAAQEAAPTLDYSEPPSVKASSINEMIRKAKESQAKRQGQTARENSSRHDER